LAPCVGQQGTGLTLFSISWDNIQGAKASTALSAIADVAL
jgi:hypothetical protein